LFALILGFMFCVLFGSKFEGLNANRFKFRNAGQAIDRLDNIDRCEDLWYLVGGCLAAGPQATSPVL